MMVGSSGGKMIVNSGAEMIRLMCGISRKTKGQMKN